MSAPEVPAGARTVELLLHKGSFLSMNDRRHPLAHARMVKSLRQMGYWHARGANLQDAHLGRTRVDVHITRPRRGGIKDPANAHATLKPMIDGMVDAGVWTDDDHTHVVGPFPLFSTNRTEGDFYRLAFLLYGVTPGDVGEGS